MNTTTSKATATPRKFWHFTPDLPIQTAPYFVWPLKPLASLSYLLKSWNPLSWRLLMLLCAFVTWYFFTPDISRAQTLEFGWIAEIWLRNFVILFGIAGGLHLWLFRFAKQGDEFHYDTKPMARNAKLFHFKNQVWDNMFWSFVALQFWTFWECLMYWSYANGWATMISFASNPLWFIVLLILIPIWAAVHFYGLHRLLHKEPFYTKIHAWHHKNVNTGPWSGLAMHPVESFFLMFDTVIFFILPAHPMHVIFLLFHHGIGAPTSHTGFHKLKVGSLQFELGDFYHQLHHRFFECNYGTTETPWDEWFDTFHDGSPEWDRIVIERKRQAAKVKLQGR